MKFFCISINVNIARNKNDKDYIYEQFVLDYFNSI